MALGAGRARVLWQILKEGIGTALIGIVLGSFGAYWVGRAMQGMVFGVGTIDPVAFSVVALTCSPPRCWPAWSPRGARHRSIR